MSAKFDGINANSVNSSVAIGESRKRGSGGLVDDLECKMVMGNPSNDGILTDDARVLQESKVLDGEWNVKTVNSETEIIESGPGMGFEMNDKYDETKNRVVELMSHNDGWGSWGVMDLVGRVLDGNFCMDSEVEDVKIYGPEVNLVEDTNEQLGAIVEPPSANEISFKGTVIGEDSDKVNLGCPAKGNYLNGNQDLVTNERVPDENLEIEEVNNVKADLLIPKERGDQYVTEKEGEYYVSDLVWGKVRSHPWWPGQIFSSSAASDKAMIYFKRESYLIMYFGDQTFAWNEGSKIKPFRMYFSQMEKQSSTEGFCHAMGCALDEVARRIELGLSCPCLPQEVHNKITSQVVANAGIREESSKRDGRDNLSGAASFLPEDLVQFLKSLAEAPHSQTDRLQFAIAKAQLLAFSRWKGLFQLSVLEERGELLEDDTQFIVKGEGRDSLEVMEGFLAGSEGVNETPSKKRKLKIRDGFSRKRKHLSDDEECPKIKEKCLSILMSSSSSSFWNDEKKPIKKTGRRTISSGKKGEPSHSIPSKSELKRRKCLVTPWPSDNMASQPNICLRAGESICKALETVDNISTEATCRNGGTLASHGVEKSQREKMIPAEFPTPDEILSGLSLVAKAPMQGHDFTISAVVLLRELRNSICLEKFSLQNKKQHARKHEEKQSSNLDATDTFGFEGTEDSYWTDRIIQSYSQNQELFDPKTPNERATELEAGIGVLMNLDSNKERDAAYVEATENSTISMNEASEEYSPTALALNFTNLDSIPSITNLNEIFRRYGPLNESETEILSKSKRAMVIFQRRADAETAFSSTGKYSIFGPSLVSYRLNYAPTPRKSCRISKQNKTHSSKGNVV